LSCWQRVLDGQRARRRPPESARNIWRARMVTCRSYTSTRGQGQTHRPLTSWFGAAVCFAVVCTLCPSLAHSKPYARLGFITYVTNNDHSDLCTQPRVSGVSVWLQASLASSQLTRCAWPLVQLHGCRDVVSFSQIEFSNGRVCARERVIQAMPARALLV
jgi:hypothetical protein